MIETRDGINEQLLRKRAPCINDVWGVDLKRLSLLILEQECHQFHLSEWMNKQIVVLEVRIFGLMVKHIKDPGPSDADVSQLS